MKKFVQLGLSIIFVLSLFISGIPQRPNPSVVSAASFSDAPIKEVTDVKIYSRATINDNYLDNIVLVGLTQKATFEFRQYTIKDFPEVQLNSVRELTNTTAEKVQKQELTKAQGKMLPEGELKINVNTFRRILELELQENSKENVLKTIRLLGKREDILCAEPSYLEIPPSDEEIRAIEPVSSTQSASPAPWASTSFNDPHRDKQMEIFNQIHLPQAWNVSKGSSTVLVGVIESSGFDAAHEDLRNRINLGLSRDYSKPYPHTVSRVEDFAVTGTHGTAVAGIIGAEGNNGKGIAGVCWDVRLVLFKINALQNSAESIIHATDNNIPILNYSAGSIGGYDSIVWLAIRNYPGLFVAAAGNDSVSTDINQFYPAGYRTNGTTGDRLPNIISVGATTVENGTERRAVYPDDGWKDIDNYRGSNWGATTVDIFAPGTCVGSTLTTQATQPGKAPYSYFTGTSFAAPLVAGVAALIKALNPEATTSQIKNQILSESDLLEISTPSGSYWSRRVNALRAVFAQGKAYYIKNVSTGQYMTVSGTGTGTGMNVVQASFTGSTRQQFIAWYEDGGFFSLQPQFNSGNSNSTRVDVTFVPLAYNLLRIQNLNHSDRQKLKTTYYDGKYRLTVSGSLKTLEPLTSNNNEIHDVAIQASNMRQYWTIIRV